MRHITSGDKSFFLDDASAECLLNYLTALSDTGASDIVRLDAISSEGTDVEVNMFLNTHTELASESTSGHMQGPENARAIEYMHRQIELLRRPPSVQPGSDPLSGEDGP